MFHICKAKDGQFYVVLTAGNHEVLSVSELLNQKESCYTNILAQARIFTEAGVLVKDFSENKIIVFMLRPTGAKEQVETSDAPVHIYDSEKTGRFYVVLRGKNHEVLSSSEILNHKQSAYGNIQSQMVNINSEETINVQDNTGESPKTYWLRRNGEIVGHQNLKISPVPVIKNSTWQL